MQSSGQSLAGDKFLYTHDVGDEEVCKVSTNIEQDLARDDFFTSSTNSFIYSDYKCHKSSLP